MYRVAGLNLACAYVHAYTEIHTNVNMVIVLGASKGPEQRTIQRNPWQRMPIEYS